MLFQIADANTVALGHFLLFFGAGVRQACNIDHSVFALRQELVKRRIERSDHDRKSVHGFKKPGEVFPLHGQKLFECVLSRFFVPRKDHRLHMRDAIFGEEHMLRTAEPNPLGAKQTSLVCIAWNISIRSNTEVAAKLIGPFHEYGEVVRFWIGLICLALAKIYLAQSAIERNPVAFLENGLVPFEKDSGLLLSFIHSDR